MQLKKIFSFSFNMLVHSKLRSWLTIIGIVIGIASIVAIVSIGDGAKQSIQQQLGDMGVDIITLSPGYSQAQSMGGRSGGFTFGRNEGSSDIKLTETDLYAVESLDNIKNVMGSVSGRAEVVYIDKTANVNIKGVDALVWQETTTSKLKEGRFLLDSDKNRVVLGGRVANSTFKDIKLNDNIKINNSTFIVVGILDEAGGMGGEDSNIIMITDSARDVLDNIDSDQFTSILIQIENVDLADETLAAIDAKLMETRNVDAESKDFTLSSAKAMQETIAQAMNTLSLFLGSIAAISLVVGAIGIMNSMFTSVMEKTKEIGIMKAIGAKNNDILLIFLFNSGIIGLTGGIGGIILGTFVSSMIGSAGGLTSSAGQMGRMFASTAVTPELLIFALGFSLIIGILAGAIPAYNASKLKPVDALRYE